MNPPSLRVERRVTESPAGERAARRPAARGRTFYCSYAPRTGVVRLTMFLSTGCV